MVGVLLSACISRSQYAPSDIYTRISDEYERNRGYYEDNDTTYQTIVVPEADNPDMYGSGTRIITIPKEATSSKNAHGRRSANQRGGKSNRQIQVVIPGDNDEDYVPYHRAPTAGRGNPYYYPPKGSTQIIIPMDNDESYVPTPSMGDDLDNGIFSSGG